MVVGDVCSNFVALCSSFEEMTCSMHHMGFGLKYGGLWGHVGVEYETHGLCRCMGWRCDPLLM